MNDKELEQIAEIISTKLDESYNQDLINEFDKIKQTFDPDLRYQLPYALTIMAMAKVIRDHNKIFIIELFKEIIKKL
jgi:hypothetical protein